MQYRELFWRTAFDLRMLGSSLLSARGGIWPKVVLLLGAVCTVAPFDLVPGRIPVIGYLGEFTSGVISMVAAFRLLPQAYRDEYRSSLAGGDALPAWMPVHSGAGHGSATPRWLQVDARQVQLSALRLVILQSVALLVARPLLRVVIGRWPVAADVTAFRASFTYFEPNPPLLRALASVPAARHQLTRAMLISWMEADERYRAGLKAELRSAVPMRGDLLEVWLGRPVAFMHLEKTAGMSVASFLTTRFHPLQIDPDPNRVFPPHVLTSFPPHVAEQARRYPLVWGHYDLPSLRRLGADRFVFTFLREPKARILSLHWYWRSHGPLDMGRDGSNQPVLAAQSLSLIDFLRCEDPAVRNHTDGFYVRRLTGLYQTDWDGDPLLADPEGCLRAALDALASMDFVGITEDVAGSMAALGSKLGFEPPPRMPRVNVTRRRGGDASDGQELLGPVNPSVATELAWLTRSDQVIYTAAARRHRRNV